MIKLTTTTQKLQAVLSGAVTTNQLPVTVCYSDDNGTTYVGGTQITDTNSTTQVDICAAPGASTVRDIDYLSVVNLDTAAATITILIDTAATDKTLVKVTLAVGDFLEYSHGTGWRVLDANGALKNLSPSGYKLSAFAATTSAELATVISDETGTGALVLANSPTLVTPTLGEATVTSLNSGPLAGFRNVIIGGDFSTNPWQYGTSWAPTAGITYGGADRWYGSVGAPSAGTFSRDTSAPTGFKNSLKMQKTAGNAGTSPLRSAQIVESSNCYGLQGKTLTLSWYAKCGANFSAASSQMRTIVRTGTGVDEGSSTFNSGTWTGNVTDVNSLLTSVSTSWARYSTTFTVGSGITELGVELGWVPSGTAGADDSLYIAGVQLEIGSVATPFEQRPIGIELALCQRYLPAFNSSGTTVMVPASPSPATSTSAVDEVMMFSVKARVAPTGLSVSNGAHFTVSDNVTNTACTTVSFVSSSGSVDGCQVKFTVGGTPLTQYRPYSVYCNNAAGQILFTGCEL